MQSTHTVQRIGANHLEISKFLSYVLRHRPDSIGILLDQNGWVEIDELLSGAAGAGRNLDLDLLRAVVAENDKNRFTISEDGLRIRAAQGHSHDAVDIQYPRAVPPEKLYHGTASRFLESILECGLLSQSRHHVHLSEEIETAIKVGRRYGKPIVLTVAAGRMHALDYKFMKADNGVWLVKRVPPEFILGQS